ncbi:MAG: hypothetical protein U0354_15435 [Candidatus Sericytochromatia bacterium]
MLYVLTTVGTSIFGNLKKELNEEQNKYIDQLKTKDSFNIEDPILSQIREKVKEISLRKDEFCYRLSAEITSLKKIKEDEDYYKEQEIKIKFILTDTIESEVATILLEDFFSKQPNYFKIDSSDGRKKIEGLQVKDFKKFEEKGLINLLEEVNKIKDEVNKIKDEVEKLKKARIILNLTGGYKGMIPFLTIFGQLYNIKIHYIYENGSLIKFPQLPIQFDWFKAESYYNYLSNESKIPYNPEDKIFEELQNNYLIKVDNNSYTVTSVGKLFFKYIKEKVIVSDNVMGHTMEYKILEYYLENPYEDKYFYLKRSHDLLDPEAPTAKDKKSDIDLLMKESKNSEEFISVESKPYLAIQECHKTPDEYFIKQLKTNRTF